MEDSRFEYSRLHSWMVSRAVGVAMYVFLVVLSVFWLDVPLGEALLYCLILTAVGMAVTWQRYG